MWGKKRNALSPCDIPQYFYASVCLRSGFDVLLDKDRHADLKNDIEFVPTVVKANDEATAEREII